MLSLACSCNKLAAVSSSWVQPRLQDEQDLQSHPEGATEKADQPTVHCNASGSSDTSGIVLSPAGCWLHKCSELCNIHDNGSCTENGCICVQEASFSMEQLATDMFHLHDAAIVQPMMTPVAADSQLSLEDLHQQCIAFFANWLTQILKDLPVSSFLAATSRAAADIMTGTADMPASLNTADQRSEQAHKLLEYIDRKVHSSDRESAHQDWFAMVAFGRSIQDSMARNPDSHVEALQTKLLSQMQAMLTGNMFLH